MASGVGIGNTENKNEKSYRPMLAAIMLSGCTSSNQYGNCKGAFDKPEPGVEYELSVWNTVLAIVFVETIVVPVVVVANETVCPINHPPAKVEPTN